MSAFVVGLRLTCPRVNGQWITPTAGHASSAEFWAASSEDNGVLNSAETSMYIVLATRRVIGAISRNNEKSAQRRKHCALAVARRSQKFCPAQTPFPGAQDDQNLISLVKIDARNFELSC